MLHIRINTHHPRPQIRILPNKHLRIKRHRNKESSNTTLDRHEEDITDLQTDQESKCHDDGCEGVALVVDGVGELEVEVGEEGTDVGYEYGAHG